MVSSGVVEVGPFVPLLTALLVRGLRRFLRVSVPLLYWAPCVSSFSIEAELKGPWKQDHQGFSYLGVPSSLPHRRQRWPVCFEVMSVGLIFSQTLFCFLIMIFV